MLRKALLLCIGGSALLLLSCAAVKNAARMPLVHPPEALGAGNPRCTECHKEGEKDFPYRRYDHTALFVTAHRMDAYQSEQVCDMCHSTSFCNDCHVTRSELKPPVKNPTAPARRLPHRGDFLARHRIDGRIDPTSCFRCHGSPKSSKLCVPCHG